MCKCVFTMTTAMRIGRNSKEMPLLNRQMLTQQKTANTNTPAQIEAVKMNLK